MSNNPPLLERRNRLFGRPLELGQILLAGHRLAELVEPLPVGLAAIVLVRCILLRRRLRVLGRRPELRPDNRVDGLVRLGRGDLQHRVPQGGQQLLKRLGVAGVNVAHLAARSLPSRFGGHGVGFLEGAAGYDIARRRVAGAPSVHERKILRLIRRGRGEFDRTLKVHEGIIPDGEVMNAKRGSVLHYRPLPIDEQILKENKYSTLKTEQWMERGGGPRGYKMFVNPPLYFYRLFLYNGLWRCGMPGFIQAMTGAVYSFLTEAKIYQRHAQRRWPSFDDMEGKIPRPDGADNTPGHGVRRRAA